MSTMHVHDHIDIQGHEVATFMCNSKTYLLQHQLSESKFCSVSTVRLKLPDEHGIVYLITPSSSVTLLNKSFDFVQMHKPMLPKDAVSDYIFFRSTWKFWPNKLNLSNPIQIQVKIDEIKKFKRTICILKQLKIKQHDHGPLHGVTQCRPKAIISKKCRKLTWKENTNCMSFSFHAVNENYSQIHRTLLVPLTSSLTTYRKCSFSLFILTENLINNSGIILCWIAISGANTSLFTSHCVGRFNKAQVGPSCRPTRSLRFVDVVKIVPTYVTNNDLSSFWTLICLY